MRHGSGQLHCTTSHSQDPKHRSGGSWGPPRRCWRWPSTEHLNRWFELTSPIWEFANWGFFVHFFSFPPLDSPPTNPALPLPPTGWERGRPRCPAAPSISGGFCSSHPGISAPSHAAGTRAARLPNRRCRMRSSKDKIRAGMRGPQQTPSLRTGDDGDAPALGGSTDDAEPGADFILGHQKRKPKTEEKRKGKELHRPQPDTPTEGPKQRAATKPKQRSEGRRNVAHSLLGLCFARAPGAGLEVQASKRGFRCS